MPSPVYIIIVTYNGSKWLRECLAAALASDMPVQLVIIDNGSTDETLDIIKEYPLNKIHVIQTGNNLGFGKANNIGIKYALEQNAAYIALVNQDLYIERNTISSCLKYAECHPEYGILSPIHMNGDGTEMDKNFAYNYQRAIEHGLNKSNEIQDMTFVMAAFWFIPVTAIQKVGMFDDIFVHYGEDNDLCNRVRFHNWKIGVLTQLQVYHDRHYRKVNMEGRLKVKYAEMLAAAMNINDTEQDAFRTAKQIAWRQMTKALLHCSLREIRKNIQLYRACMHKQNTIINHRANNQK